MLDYTIFTDKDGIKFAKYSINGEEYKEVIETNDDGYEYYTVPNIIHPIDINYGDSDYMFTNRIKDAVDTIRKGDADILVTNRIFSFDSTFPIKFVDKEYGNMMRQKFITEFKDAKFCYAIKGGWTCSFNGYNYITEDGKENIFSESKVKTFDTIDDALSYINSLLAKATSLASDYITGSDADKDKIIKPLRRDGVSQVIYKLFRSKINVLTSTKNEAGEYTLQVSQYMILPR